MRHDGGPICEDLGKIAVRERSRPRDVSAPPAGAGPADGDAGDVHALRERISARYAVSVHISASLDLPTPARRDRRQRAR